MPVGYDLARDDIRNRMLCTPADVSMFKECQVLQQEHRSLVRRNRKLHEDIQSLEAKVTEIREQMTVKRDLQYEDLPSVNQVESCEVGSPHLL